MLPADEGRPLRDIASDVADPDLLAAAADVLADLRPRELEVSAGEDAWFLRRILPYRLQDGYNRRKQPRDFASVVLENDQLKATFLPELGARLVSLVHRATNRELLDRNLVFQPANLALRNSNTGSGPTRNYKNPCEGGHEPRLRSLS